MLEFRICIARSTDLIHWTRVAVLDPTGASMPTLRAGPRRHGFLLAYEKRIRDGGNIVRLRYYPSLYWLLSGGFADQRDLPRQFSPYNDGTPTIEWVHWNGGLNRSSIGLGFHYETAPAASAGPDREATGTLRRFRTWTAYPDPSARTGPGPPGTAAAVTASWRQFSFDGDQWRAVRGPERV